MKKLCFLLVLFLGVNASLWAQINTNVDFKYSPYGATNIYTPGKWVNADVRAALSNTGGLTIYQDSVVKANGTFLHTWANCAATVTYNKDTNIIVKYRSVSVTDTSLSTAGYNIKLDKTKPIVLLTPTPATTSADRAPDSALVRVQFNDALSGIDSAWWKLESLAPVIATTFGSILPQNNDTTFILRLQSNVSTNYRLTISVRDSAGNVQSDFTSVYLRAKYTDSLLTSMTLTPTPLSQTPIAFNSRIFNYSVVYNYAVDAINISAVPQQGKNITIKDTGRFHIPVGDTIFKITTFAEDPIHSTVYTIKVHRKSNNDTLQSLVVKDHLGNPISFQPSFNGQVFFYNDTLGGGVNNITIEAKAAHDSAKVVGRGTFPLPFGDTTFTIKVTAEDNAYTLEYKVHLYRKSNDTTLKDITFNIDHRYAFLRPAFSPQVSNYTLMLNLRPETVEMQGVVNNPLATVTGDFSYPIELKDTTFTFTVFAEDPTFTKEYHVTVSLGYDWAELAQFKTLLEKPSTGGGNNASVVGIDLSDYNPENWDASTGIGFGVQENLIRIQSIRWSERPLAGDIDLSGFKMLTTFLIDYAAFTQLNVKNCNLLFEVDAFQNKLTSVDVQGCTNLVDINVGDNPITNLDLSGLGKLREVLCQTCNLDNLTLAGCGALKYLTCYTNNLKALNLSQCPSLLEVYCMENKLKFSTLPELGSSVIYNYGYQKDTTFNNWATTQTVDLSSEYYVAGENTQYTWRYASNEDQNPITSGIQNNNGVFTFDASFSGKGVYCLMTNLAFPDLIWRANVYFYDNSSVGNIMNNNQVKTVLYPNPARDQVSLQINNYSGKARVEFYNLSGQKIEQKILSVQDGEAQTLQLNNFSKGVYILRIFGDSWVKIERLVVQ